MADLGELLQTEPATPEEVEALRAANRARRRSRQTTTNLLLALAAAFGVVVLLVLVVVRPQQSLLQPVDYPGVVAATQQTVDYPLAAPSLPEGWSVNAAGIRTDETDGEPYWYAGFVTDENGFVGLSQRPGTDETWATFRLGRTAPTGAVSAGGISWVEYDRRDDADAGGNSRYALVGEVEGTTVMLAGTASDRAFQQLAAAVATDTLGS